ncbi:protein HVA22-like [Argentina anserina]|uniref:protein HVA22-like n=1 Tax=Argentina anserina TaxID=57926 RepID=UPI0021767394|nr:protein HVA22-like [Potentilla anserina]
MGKAWFLLTKLHSLAWPGLTLAYPLYASIMAMERGSSSKQEVEQWLAYWIMYALLSPLEMIFEPLLQWIPFWYEVKLVFMAWLVLPQFGGASFLYERFVRDHALRLMGRNSRKDHLRHQVATSRPSQPAPTTMHNAGELRQSETHNAHQNTRTHQSNTANDASTHPSNTSNDQDTSTRVAWRSMREGQSRLVHKPGKRRTLWHSFIHCSQTRK